jgi:hypothetical protein
MILDGETIKTKVVDLKELCNFVVDNFLFKIIYACKIMFEFLTFEFFKRPRMEEWPSWKL